VRSLGIGTRDAALKENRWPYFTSSSKIKINMSTKLPANFFGTLKPGTQQAMG
jgi:hypothetical protein